MTTTTMLVSAPSYDSPNLLMRAPSYDIGGGAPGYDSPNPLVRAPSYDIGAALPSYSAVDSPPAYSLEDLPHPPRAPEAPLSILAQAARARQPNGASPPAAPEFSLLGHAARARQGTGADPSRYSRPRPPSAERPPRPETSLLAQAALARQAPGSDPSLYSRPRQSRPPSVESPETSLLAQAALARQGPAAEPSFYSRTRRSRPQSVEIPAQPEFSLLAEAARARRPESVHTPRNGSAGSSPRASIVGNIGVAPPRSVVGYHLGAEVGGGRWSVFGGSGAEEYQFTAQTVNGKLRMVTASLSWPRGQEVVAEVEGEWMSIFEDRMKAGTMGTVVRGRALRWVWVHKGLLVMEGEEVVGRWVYAKRWKRRLDGGVLEVFEKGLGGRDIVALVLAVVGRKVLGKE